MSVPFIELPPNPSMRFTGRIYPAFLKVSFGTRLAIELPPALAGSPYYGLDAKFQFTITDSEVDVRCYLNRVDPTDFDQIFYTAYELVRCAVDLMAFSRGMGLTVILDKAILPDGSTRDIQRYNLKLQSLCTAFTIGHDPSLERTLVDLFSDRQLIFALRDLTETLEDPYRDRINCARAVEALAQIISPGEKNDRTRWNNLRQALNLR